MTTRNLAVVEGRLVGDPEIRYTQSGTALCRFSIANNCDYYKENELRKEVNFFDVTTWAKLAERCNEYLSKGRRVMVNGRLRHDRWQDDEGTTHSRVYIVGNGVRFLDRREDEDKTGGTDGDEPF